jgi:hypothetical protein
MMKGTDKMAGLYDMVYTLAGRNLLADIIAKEATLDITKIVVGKGYVPDEKNMEEMETVAVPVMELPIKKKTRVEERPQIIIGSEFDNTNIENPFYYRELGVYAKGIYPDGSESEETLYLYGNAGDSAEYIPAHSGSVVVEKRIDVIVYVGGKTNVSLEVAEAFYTTKEELEEAVQKLESETIPITQKGAAGGVAELDDNGKVPSAQLPSYVDDVLEYDAVADFPATGESGKIYVDAATNLTYRWSGSGYVEISQSLALGETASTAFRGDHGKQAYDNAAQALELFNSIMDEETIQLAQELGFLSGGLTLLNSLLRLLLTNPTVETGTDKNGFSYKKHANGEGEWRKKITFTTPEWSGNPHLYYCTVNVYEVPESVKEYDTIQFVVKDASGAQVHVAIVTPYPDRMYFALSRVYGGTDALRVTGHLIITGKWK